MQTNTATESVLGGRDLECKQAKKMTVTTPKKLQRRYKHTGSLVPDFVFAEWYDSETETLTISAQDFDSIAVAELVIHNDYGVVAHEDETRQSARPSASVIVEISGIRFRAFVVRQRQYGTRGGEQGMVRLSIM
ncbi:MAG: hypothetical protein KKC79_12765 [Gammaproteobacteria bacterium]|nr:hypothetical protein [Gammaproteobacteria bacterium]MBU2409504.1 hypothetical protein [Gammaproteobacteria bacterium]